MKQRTSAFKRVRAGWLCLAGMTLAAGVVHCSSFGSDGAAEPSPVDGGSGDSPSANDATPGTDGGTGGSLCSSPHALCDDFNRSGSPFDSMRWGTELGDGGTLGTPSYATSPALLVTSTTLSGYRLQKTISGPFQSVRCTLRLYIEDTGSNSYGIPFSIALAGSVSETTYLSLRRKDDPRPGNFVEDVASLAHREYEFFAVGPGTWSTVEVEVPTVRLWLNGVEKPVDAPDGGFVTGPFASGTVEVGFSLNSPDAPWRVALDDVACDVRQ